MADRFLGLDGAVGFDVDDQLVQVGALFDARGIRPSRSRGAPG